MQQHITKLCADSLRTFTNDKYGIKLKASHAHELVASLFGYKSRAALLADTVFPLDNLQESEVIVFDPSPCNTGVVGQRLIELQQPYLNAFELADCFRSTLCGENWFSQKRHVSLGEVSIHIAEQDLHRKLKMLGIDPSSIEWQITGELYCWEGNEKARLQSDVNYFTDSGTLLKYSSYTTYVSRIAANLGYRILGVEPTYYSGEARKTKILEEA